MKKILKFKKIIIIGSLFLLFLSFSNVYYADTKDTTKIEEDKQDEILLDDIYYAMDIVYSLIDKNKESIPIEKRINIEKILNGSKFYLDGFITTENYKQLVAINLNTPGHDIDDLKLRNMIDGSINRIVEASTSYKMANDSTREDLDEISDKRNSVYADTEEVKLSDAPFNKKLFLFLNKLVAVIVVVILIYFSITII